MSADYRYTSDDGTEWEGHPHGTWVSVSPRDAIDYSISIDQEIVDVINAIWGMHTRPDEEND